MIRIIVVDDLSSPEFLQEMKRTINASFQGTEVEIEHLNPTQFFVGLDDQRELSAFRQLVQRRAVEFWDAAIIDVNLAEVKLDKAQKPHLSIQIANDFRECNHSATIILYSGTLSDHIQNLLSSQMPAESVLKKVFHAEISAFVPRRMIGDEVYWSLDNPSWLLRVDRSLMQYAAYKVGPDESEFKGRTFADLAKAVRCQNIEGKRVTQLITELGLSSLVDLNS